MPSTLLEISQPEDKGLCLVKRGAEENGTLSSEARRIKNRPITDLLGHRQEHQHTATAEITGCEHACKCWAEPTGCLLLCWAGG